MYGHHFNIITIVVIIVNAIIIIVVVVIIIIINLVSAAMTYIAVKCICKQGRLSPNNQGIPQLPLFPHPSLFPLSLSSPLPSLLQSFSPLYFPPAANRPPWNQLGDLGSAVSSPSGVWGEAPADIDFSVF